VGTLLWNPFYVPATKFAVPRPNQFGYAIGWVAHTIDFYGRTTVVTEHTFGGYKAVFAFKTGWWTWSTRANTLDYIWEDAYALAPGSSTPISLGSTEVQWKLDPTYHVPLIVLTLAGADGHYSVYRFPSSPTITYRAPFPPVRPTPFFAS